MRNIFFKETVKFFPKEYPWYKRTIAQALFLGASIVIQDRDNLLTQKDIRGARKVLQRGDILLVGNLRLLFSKLVSGPVTHSLLYIGKRRFVHATVDGVGYITYQEVANMYDTMVILRVPESHRTRTLTTKAIRFARAQVGKAYNFFLNEKELSFFCSQLVNSAYLDAGYDTQLQTRKRSDFGIDMILHPRAFGIGALQASDFVKGQFGIVFTSQNLSFRDNKLQFISNDISPSQSLHSDTVVQEE